MGIGRYAPGWTRQAGIWGLGAALLAGGCSRDPRNLPPEMPQVSLGAFEAYGQRLDENADPKQVAAVWVQALRDFGRGNREDNAAMRTAALKVLARLAAPYTIRQLLGGRVPTSSGRPPPIEEVVYLAIRMWTAATSHYIDKAELDHMLATKVRKVLIPPGKPRPEGGPSDLVEVLVPAVGRSGDRALLAVGLAREQNLWRVAKVVLKPPAGEATATIRLPMTRPPGQSASTAAASK